MAIVPRSGADTFFRSRAPRDEDEGTQLPAAPTSQETRDAGAASFFAQRRQRDDDQLMAARAAAKLDAERARKANRLAPFVGLPPDTVERNLGEVEGNIRGDAAVRAMRGNPRLADWMGQPRNAAAASDDIPTVKAIADQFKSFWGEPENSPFGVNTLWRSLTDPAFRARQERELQRGLTIGAGRRANRETAAAAQADGFFDRAVAFARKGFSSLEAGLYSVGGALQEWDANNPLPWTSPEATAQSRAKAKELKLRAQFLSGAAPIVRGETTWDNVKRNPFTGIVPFVAEQGIQSIPGMVAAGAALPVFITSQAGNIGRDRANNNGRTDADIADVVKAVPAAVASAVLERIGINRIFNAGGATIARRVAGAAAAEGATEFAQGAIEYAGGSIGTDAGFSFNQALDSALQGAVAGFGMGGAIRGVQETLSSGVRRVVEARQAEAGGEMLGRLMDRAAASKLREGDPSAFQAFLAAQAEGTAVENVFIPAEKVRELYQEQGRSWDDPDDDFFGSMAPDFRDQMATALQSGGDVVIPTAAFAARLAGSPEWEAIRGDVRVSPGGMSPNEAASFEDSWAEEMASRQAVMEADLQAEQEAAAPRQRVFDNVFSMARQSGFSVNASRAYADLWAERYATRAERLGDGRTALDLFNASVAGIQSDLPRSLEPYRKGDQLDILINAMRKGAAPVSDQQRLGPSLATYLAGTVDDLGGDLESMGALDWHREKPGRRKFIRKTSAELRSDQDQGGMLGGSGATRAGLDDALQRAIEAGYFPELAGSQMLDDASSAEDGPDVQILLDALEAEFRGGTARYPSSQGTAAQEAQNVIAQAADDLRSMLESRGVDPDNATKKEIADAIAAFNLEQEADRSFDQAAIDVDGVDRPTTNSEGRPIARTAEGLANFWRWFGDSKVVDDQGRPLVVYHGTTSDIEAFDRNRLGENTQAESARAGFFFVDDASVAQSYAHYAAVVRPVERLVEEANAAERKGDWDEYDAKIAAAEELETALYDNEARLRGQNVIPVYLKIEGPSELDAGGESFYGAQEEVHSTIRRAKRSGDGAIFRNLDDDAGFANREANHFLVFDPTQIKSVNNRGTFDPADPRILFQGRDEGGGRGRIDFMADNTALITLFESHDLSTLLHEGGHLWLEELRADALSLPGSKVAKDWDTVKAWFKREGIEVGDGDMIPTEAHELWARGMERYFMEGKAPSSALVGAFASFRAWLLRIYQVVTRLDANIDASVRGVMDRLIATDSAIAWAIHENETKLMFDAQAATETLGMSGAEFNAYAQLLDDNRTEAFNALLYRTMERIRRGRTKAYQDEEARVRVDVAAEVNDRPEVRALAMLRGVNGAEYQPLDRESVIERVGQEGIRLLPAGRAGKPSVRAGGMHADTMAELVGFRDGRELIEALIGIEARRKELVAAGDPRSPIEEAIDLETDRVMADRQPDAFDDGSIEEEALEAIHNDKGSAILAAEYRQLSRAVGEAPTPESVIKSWAERVVREGRIVDQASGTAVARHQRAERMAGRAAERAYLDGNIEEAFRQKQKQLVANALYRAASDAKAKVDVIARRMDRLARSRGLKGMDPEYLDRIHELLERYDLRKRSEREIKERESFERWAKAQEEKGIEVFVPERLTLAGNKNFTRLTFDDLTALDDAVQSLAHLGRQKAELLVAREKALFEEIVGEAKVNASGLRMRPWSPDRNPKPRWLNEIDAFMTKIAFLAQQLDGDRPDGVFTRTLIWGAREAANQKAALQRRVLDPIAAAYHAMPKAQQKRLAERVTVPEFVSQNPETLELIPTTFVRMELLAMALNVGNQSNLEKMLVGETRALPQGLQFEYGWTVEKVMDVLNRELTKEDWDFVQTTWDSVESLWPDLVKSEREITGITPEKVEPREVVTAYGTYSGGYYPVVYDPSRSQRVADNEAETAKSMMGYVGRTVATQKGHTITRIDAAYPLLFSVEHVLFRHVDQVATRIAYAPYLRSALKFIGDERIKKIVVDHAGPEYYKQLKPWLSRQVNEGARDALELNALWRILRSARVNATAVGLGFRLTTIAAQPAGLTSSIAEIGADWVARGVNEVRKAPVETYRFVMDSSPMMSTRAQDFDRDVRLFYSQLARGTTRDDRTVMGKLGRVGDALKLDAIRGAAFWGIGNMQLHAVDIPTWMGAYLKEIEAGGSIAQARAIADDVVTNTQGGGRAMDLSAIQDSGEGARFLTMFYSWFAVMYNIQRKAVRLTKEGDYRRAAVYALWIGLIGPLLSAALTGDTPDEEEDWFAWAFRKISFGMFASVPVVRDVAAGVERTITGKFTGASEPPIYRAASEIQRPVMDAIRVGRGDEPSERWLRNAIVPIGYFTGLPTGQVGTTAQYALDVAEGDQNPQDAGDVLYGIAKGPQKDQE